MKHIQLIFLSIVSLTLLFGCTTTISKLEIDNQSNRYVTFIML